MSENKITRQTNIMDALDVNPDAAEILMEAGLGCIGCSLAHAESIEQGLLAHGFDDSQIDEIIKRLNA